MFKLMKLGTNPHVRPLIQITNVEHGYPTRRRSEIQVPFPRVESVKINFEYQFIDIWNSIQDDVKNAPSVNVFKKRMNGYIFEHY